MSCRDTALALVSLGQQPVIVPAGEKGPKYKGWERRSYTADEIHKKFVSHMGNVGILLGKVIDIECDNEQAATDLVELFDGDPPTTVCFQSTKGKHYLFLADDRLKAIGKATMKWKEVEVRLGTAGGRRGAQSLLPPSSTNGKTRAWINDLATPFAALPEAVIAKLLPVPKSQAKPDAKSEAKPLGDSPGDDYCKRAEWSEILCPHGWVSQGTNTEGKTTWTRPGKDGGVSATTGFCSSEAGRDLLYVFTTEAKPLQPGTSYSKFAAYAYLNFDGDFSAAAESLIKEGYGELIRSIADPSSLANAHIEKWAHNGVRTSVHLGETLYVWRGNEYVSVTDKMMYPYISATIEEVFERDARETKKQPRMVSSGVVNNTLNMLKTRSRLDTTAEPPFWLTDRDDADEYIPFANGLLHYPSYLLGKDNFQAPTPQFFNRHKLGFNYDPSAPEPKRWLQFLDEVWEDKDCHDLLHEWGGYCMTRETHLQKMMMLVGASRGGKGTIRNIFCRMVGGNFCSPTYKTITGEFGLAPMVGRQIAFFPDGRYSDRVLSDATGIIRAITGEDPVTVNVKHKPQLDGVQLKIKIVLQSNEFLVLPDNSGAIQARQLYLHFVNTFRGREDFDLGKKLELELPGIANFFLQGLKRLKANGVFTEPESSKQLAARMYRQASPLAAFVDDCCELNDKYATQSKRIYEAYLKWVQDSDDTPLDKQTFGKAFQETVQTIKHTQNVAKFKVDGRDGDRPYYYTGIQLKKQLKKAA